jgi:hypothetical protein
MNPSNLDVPTLDIRSSHSYLLELRQCDIQHRFRANLSDAELEPLASSIGYQPAAISQQPSAISNQSATAIRYHQSATVRILLRARRTPPTYPR